MRKHTLIRTIACITAAVSLSAAFSCSGRKPSTSQPESVETTTEPTTASGPRQHDERLPDLSGQTINWLADYDINPGAGQERSVALALFEDVCGAKVNYIPCGIQDKFSMLQALRVSGEGVDMFPFDYGVLPNGVFRGLFEPLDQYYDEIGVDTTLWSDMESVTESLAFNGEHYVLPYSLSNPTIITYSRKLMKDTGLADPYTMWQDGTWNWDTFLEMMEAFTSLSPQDGITRYGISGIFGKAALCSSGARVVNYNNLIFTNNITDPVIGASENLLRNIRDKKLLRPGWNNFTFSPEMNTLFFAMGDWALSDSVAACPEADLMVVPFPKAPEASGYFSDCTIGAKMLVNGSDKGEAVAAYIRCERLAAAKSEYRQTAREQALGPRTGNTGGLTSELYDALQECLDPTKVAPLYDYGYGMEKGMYDSGDYSYDTRGVMNNMEEAMLNGDITAWEELRDKCSPVIDTAVAHYNK